MSRLFANSARLVRFLRFTVDEVLNGRGHLLKEHLIGTRVYDRPDDYDPRVDSVVRVGYFRPTPEICSSRDISGDGQKIATMACRPTVNRAKHGTPEWA